MKQNLTVTHFRKSLSELDRSIDAYRKAAQERGVSDAGSVLAELETTRTRLFTEFFAHLTTWDQVELAREEKRPYTLDYVRMICDEFVELHGDRHVGDDQAIVGGPAQIDSRRVMLIGQQKGRDLKERMLRNFGYPRPEGYRKALRLMKLAEKLRMPVITLVDTPGADSNLHSEEHAISEAIAVNLMEMAVLRAPIICAVIGEGGSGGALGIAVADRVLMLEHSIYSVIAPEGCAAILETFGRDPSRKPEAATALRVDAASCKDLGIIEEVLPEPLGGADADPEAAGQTLKAALVRNIDALSAIPTDDLLDQRYQKYRNIGQFDVIGS